MISKRVPRGEQGKLRIGDDWNAITIIALSQNNPLKAIAEFVENSIDAGARNVTIVRGKDRGHHFLKIADDGAGIPCAAEGIPDFKYVATHICDSLKRRLKEQGASGIQGEFGIGLLSFWTVGHRLTLISSGNNSKAYQMVMEKGKPGYRIAPRPHLVPSKGTQVIITPLLEGMRQLSGEKIQRYLASELRDRIKQSEVKIKIFDRNSRSAFDVEPRRYSGQLLHNLPAVSTPLGDIYLELYLNDKDPQNCISLYRAGTRVLPNISTLDEFQAEPWSSGYFGGIIDAGFLQLTPGTRDGIIRDESYAQFCRALSGIQESLAVILEGQRKSEGERIHKNILRSVQKALREAVLSLPPEEYDWFDIHRQSRKDSGSSIQVTEAADVYSAMAETPEQAQESALVAAQKQFFDFPGPLYCARISPASLLVQVGKSKTIRAIGMDQRRRRIDDGLVYLWSIAEGAGRLENVCDEIALYQAPEEPGLCRIAVSVSQGATSVEAGAVITVVDSIIKADTPGQDNFTRGLPGYTVENAPGKLWRSRYDKGQNIIVINSGHRDFLYAQNDKMRKIRYICRLFSKELILHNFPGAPTDQLLERLVELSLYTEENLR